MLESSEKVKRVCSSGSLPAGARARAPARVRGNVRLRGRQRPYRSRRVSLLRPRVIPPPPRRPVSAGVSLKSVSLGGTECHKEATRPYHVLGRVNSFAIYVTALRAVFILRRKPDNKATGSRFFFPSRLVTVDCAHLFAREKAFLLFLPKNNNNAPILWIHISASGSNGIKVKNLRTAMGMRFPPFLLRFVHKVVLVCSGSKYPGSQYRV